MIYSLMQEGDTMNLKYEKPVARNLGEMLPSAEGYCLIVGNSASHTNQIPDCRTGNTASGASCWNGGIPSNQACNATGNDPVWLGCLNGLAANPAPCSTGDGVY